MKTKQKNNLKKSRRYDTFAREYVYPEEDLKEVVRELKRDLFNLEEKKSKETGINSYDVLIVGDDVRNIIDKRFEDLGEKG